jgi:IS4 transposase
MSDMMLDAIFERFAKGSAITVMAQLGLERVLAPSWLDEVFDEYRGRQYEREVLFSTVVDIVALVALGLQPSVHAAARARQDIRVSLGSLYDKINHTEPALGRALLKQSVQRLTPVVEHLQEEQSSLCPGYRVRIVDGNCLAPSEKRLKPLRKVRRFRRP